MGNCCSIRNKSSVNLKNPDRINIRKGSNSNLSRKMNFSSFRFGKSNRSSMYAINNENITEAYNFEGRLGEGYYGMVRMASPKNDPNKKYAVKSIDKTKLKPERIKKLVGELEILIAVDHPNIVKYYETYNDENYLHIVMELCTGGELFDRIASKKRFSEKEAANVVYKLVSAVSHCHSLGIVHRDLKPENILYESQSEFSDLKIIDFGLSRKFPKNGQNLSSVVGSPYYVAPEVLEGDYDLRCDIWSIGVIAYVLLSGNPPFYSNNKPELYFKIHNEKPKFESEIWKHISYEAIEFIICLLQKDPKLRPKTSKLLNFEWFKKMLNNEEQITFRQIDAQVLQHLKSFNQPNKFMKSVLKYIVKELKSSEIEKIKNAFMILDRDKTGTINFDQLQSAFKSNGFSLRDEELKDILGKCTGGSGGFGQKINYSAFITAAIDKKNILNTNILWETFKHFDVDKSGSINLKDFHIALKRSGKYKSETDVEGIFKEINLAKDAEINFEDFCSILQKQYE
jgi:calcium-dependent protein kinase